MERKIERNWFLKYFKKYFSEPGTAAQVSTQEQKQNSASSRPVWFTQLVTGQLGLHSEQNQLNKTTLPPKNPTFFSF